MRRFSTALTLLCFACAPSTGVTPQAGPAKTPESGGSAAGSNEPTAVSEKKANFYRQAFAATTEFVAQQVPSEMIRSIDGDNDIYVEARDEAAEIIGYLRDISAPVSIDARCECDPLNITLAFNADFTFKTVISPAPLRKHGHEAMTDADIEQLIKLMKNPPAALGSARQVEDVVDVTTGATKPEYRGAVVERAALSTRRILGLVQDTQRILQRAPVKRAQRRLQKILDDNRDPGLSRAEALATFIPEAGSIEISVQAFRLMVRDYLSALHTSDNGAGNDVVEARIINPGISKYVDPEETLAACYDLARDSLRTLFVARCTASLEGRDVNGALIARLVGTVRYQAGEHKGALGPLTAATKEINIFNDPALHLRFADTLARNGRLKAACSRARDLFVAHPLLPDVEKVLTTCVSKDGKIDPILSELRAKQREQLLSTRRSTGEAVPKLEVEDMKMKATELSLSDPDRVTVVVFFATWCPHCRTEMPRLNQFTKAVTAKPRLASKVRIFGIRTAVEKETEPYEKFAAQFKPAFPIWTDPVMALAFSRFAKSQGISPGIPTVAVIDTAGQVRYLLETGTWDDTHRELLWAVEDLLDKEK